MLATEFQSLVKSAGLRSGLRALNQEVPHRYSAVFGFIGGVLRNLCIVDKLDPDAGLLEDQPVDDSYCIYVQRSGSTVSFTDAGTDLRAEGHPKRNTLFSYYGVPLFDQSGRIRGTVCHFDERAMAVTDDVVTALDNVAPVIVNAVFGED